MTEEPVTRRECEITHDGVNKRLETVDQTLRDNFAKIFDKLDEIGKMKSDIKTADDKAHAIGEKIDKHTAGHASFIGITLGMLAILGTLISVVTLLLKGRGG